MSRDIELLGAVGIERTLSCNKYHQLSKSFPISRASLHRIHMRRGPGTGYANSFLCTINKNSSGDEIANVNFFYNIAHVEASDYAH